MWIRETLGCNIQRLMCGSRQNSEDKNVHKHVDREGQAHDVSDGDLTGN